MKCRQAINSTGVYLYSLGRDHVNFIIVTNSMADLVILDHIHMDYQFGGGEKPCKERTCISVEELMKKGRALAKEAKGSKETPGTSGSSNSVENGDKGCPADKDDLGRSTWTLLHTMSVYYPDKPSESDRERVNSFMTNLGVLYPCDFCARDLQRDLKEDPPKLGSKKEFAQWMCDLHNKVNEKTGKPQFDCSKVFERWRDGWKDGSCDY